MTIRQWLWCGDCERCFEVFLASPVDEPITAPAYLSVDGKMYVTCHYYDCDGDYHLRRKWSEYLEESCSTETGLPKPDTVYPTYPE